MSVLVVGSVAYDSVETPYGKVEDALGGSAMFFSAAASFFSPVRLVAVVGEDFGQELAFLEQRGVDLKGLSVEKGKTFRWGGKYLQNMNDRETLYTHLNVFETFNPVIPKEYQDSDYVFLANIQPELQYSVVEQVQNPKLVVMDTMNFWISGSLPALKKILSVVDVLVINDSEARELAEEQNLFQAARVIRDFGPKILVIKKGEHGALLIHEDSYFFLPAYPVESLRDPTGAGDTFAGGFVGYLAMTNNVTNANLRRAVVYGSVMASFLVEDFSVDRLRNLSKREVSERVAMFREITNFEVDIKWATK